MIIMRTKKSSKVLVAKVVNLCGEQLGANLC